MDTADVVVDVVIAGAGIIGLSIALELAAAGLRVTVVERGRAMSESSWAAAGMLAAHDPENPPALRGLADLSIRLYPEYLRRIEALAQLPVPLRSRTTLQGTRIGEVPHFSSESAGRFLSGDEASALAPQLATAGREFLLLDEASLDPRDLCAALPRAAVAAGVTLVENTCVLSVLSQGGGVTVETTKGRISAAAFVNCSGAWASQVATGNGPGSSLAIGPVKGQMLTVRVREPLPCALRTPDIYLVPRRGPQTPDDDRVAIGATVERAGFDTHVHPEAVDWLLKQAGALWPPIAEASLVETWTGLRPASPDALPLIGALHVGPDPADTGRGDERCWAATGHFRNGILLAPSTARVVAQLIQGLPAEIDLGPFAPQRFAPAASLVRGGS